MLERSAKRFPDKPAIICGDNALSYRALDQQAGAIWKAAGSLTLDGKRWIPSVVLVENYDVGATAAFDSFERTARARPVQSSTARITVIPKKIRIGLQLMGRTADSAIHRGNSGKERMTSMLRCTLASTQPP